MAYLTPDFPDGSSMTVRTIVVNAQPIDIQALLDGAISVLFEAQNFLKKGAMTEEETAQYFRDMVYEIMELCEAVAECFNDTDFLNSINESMSGLGYPNVGNTGASGSATGALVMGDILQDLEVPCEYGEDLYGVCMQVVETMHRYFSDFLELAEVYSNQSELAGKISEFIPILSNVVSGSLDLANWLQETFAENYAGAYTIPVQETIACEIFNLVLNDCELTLDVILQAYENVVGEGIDVPSNDLWEMIDYVINIPVTVAVQLVARSHIMALQLMNFAQDFLGLTPKNMRFFVGSYSGYPVADECARWCYTFDFTTSDGGFTVLSGRSATYSSGVGWKPSQYTAFGNRYNNVSLEKSFTSSQVTEAYITYTSSVLQNNVNAYDQFALYDGATQKTDTSLLATSHASPFSLTWEGSESGIDKIVLQVNAGAKSGTGAFSGGNAGDCTLLSVTLKGTGTNPFGADNCMP